MPIQLSGSLAITGSITTSTTIGAQGAINTTNATNPTSFTSTASFYTDGGVRVAKDMFVSGTAYFNNMTVYGTQSVQYITSSQLNIGTNLISVNTDTPAVRFGGLAVYDSGSTGLTGSMLWDSEANHWVYSNPSGSSYSGGMLISGPRSSALGSEQGTTFNALMKGQGGDHITSSGIFESGSNVGIGTSVPAYKLDVVNTGTNTIRVQNTSNTSDAYLIAQNTLGSTFFGINATGGYIYNGGALPIIFYTSGSERMRILSDGNVGIGSASPTYKLDVSGTTRTTDNTILASGGNYVSIGGAPFYAGTSIGSLSIRGDLYPGIAFYTGSAGSDIVGQIFSYAGTGNMILNADPNNANSATTIQFHIDDSFKMLINANGNVGIGSTSPVAKLHVVTDATAGRQNMANITRTGGNWVRFTNPQYSTVASMGLILRVFPDSDARQGAGIIASGGTNNATTDLDIFVTTSPDGLGGTSYSAIRVDGLSGNIGIGTTNPGYKLSIQGSAGIEQSEEYFYFNSTYSVGNNARGKIRAVGAGGGSGYGGDLRLSSRASNNVWNEDVLTISNAGLVGIGTTSPATKLHISNNGAYGIEIDVANEIIQAYNRSTSDYNEIKIYSSNIRFFNGTSSTITERMRITSGGSVGIGTTSPSSFLHVNSGTVSTPRGSGFSKFFFTGNNASTTYFEIQTPTGSTGDILFSDGASGDYGIIGYDHANDSMRFYTKSAINMFISGSGLVGIGTTNPLSKLHVQDTSDAYARFTRSSGTTQNLDVGTNSAGEHFVYGYGAYPLLLGTNNNTRIYITSGGNVGIGTTSPVQRLEVNGNIKTGTDNFTTVNGGWFFNGNGSYTNGIFAYNTSANLRIIAPTQIEFYTNNTERMTITSGGNVGIGTTSPTRLLELYGAALTSDTPTLRISSADSSGTRKFGIEFYSRTGADVRGKIMADNGGRLYIDDNGGGGVIMQTNGGTGNVGIGITAPTSVLHLVSTGSSIMKFFRATTTYGFEIASTTFGLYDYTNSIYRWRASNTDLLLNETSGNVGIGTTSPSARLQVTGSTNTVNFQGSGSNIFTVDGSSGRLFSVDDDLTNSLFSVNTIAGLPVIEAFADNTVRLGRYSAASGSAVNITGSNSVYINSTTNQVLDNATPQLGILAGSGTDAVSIKHIANGNNTFNIWQTGTTAHNAIVFYKGDTQAGRGNINVTTSGTTYNSTSDYRLKENIVPLENGLDRLMQLKPSKFNWIETGNESEGFIAHELQEYFPDAVTGEKDDVYSSTGNIKPQSVDYGRITPLLVKAIQELTARVQELENK